MVIWDEKTKGKASAILKQLKGMSIAEARDLLNWCGDYLMEQITVDFTRSKSYLKEHEESEVSPDETTGDYSG